MSGPTKQIAWGLLAFGSALIVFVVWHQIMQAADSRRYGIEVRLLGPLGMLASFVGLEIAALYTACKRYYGMSIFFGGIVALFLGFMSLILLSGAGM